MGALGALMLMGVARKVMLGKNWPIRALVRVAPGSRYQPAEFERRRAQAYRGRDIECAVFLNAVWRWSEDQTSTFLIAHEL